MSICAVCTSAVQGDQKVVPGTGVTGSGERLCRCQDPILGPRQKQLVLALTTEPSLQPWRRFLISLSIAGLMLLGLSGKDRYTRGLESRLPISYPQRVGDLEADRRLELVTGFAGEKGSEEATEGIWLTGDKKLKKSPSALVA